MITKECGDTMTELRKQLNELGNMFLLANEKSKLCKMSAFTNMSRWRIEKWILFLVPSCPKKKTRMFIDGSGTGGLAVQSLVLRRDDGEVQVFSGK